MTSPVHGTPRGLRAITRNVRLCAVSLMCVAWALIPAGAIRADSDALWFVVHDLCVPNEEQHGVPAPCVLVDLHGGIQNGYVLLKDQAGATQFLLIPTARVTGIESPLLLAPGAPNYFARAWQLRTYLDAAVHRVLPRDDIALAINSVFGRTQNQLHIHIDCVRADVRDALRAHDAAIHRTWGPFGVPLAGQRYMAMRVESQDLSHTNPFKLLAGGLPGAREDMGRHTLVVVGATFSDGRAGFVILDDHADLAMRDKGSGEELQDHTCAIAKP
jgi:CDP-diacylglycerol pyrophosphatase